MDNSYGSVDIDVKQEKNTPITTQQKLLLIGALLIGAVFHQAFYQDDMAAFLTWVSCAWACYAVVFLLYNRARIKTRPYSHVLLVAAMYLCVISPFQASGYSDTTLAFLNVIAIPCLLMLHAQYITLPLPLGREFGYLPQFFFGFFAQPFIHIGKCFSAVGNLFKGEKRTALIAVLITLPVAAVVLSLLLKADAVMGLYADRFMSSLNVSEYIFRFVLIAIISILFYSFLYSVTWGEQKELAIKPADKWAPQIPRVVAGTLLVIYAVFTAVQSVYLFGGHGLPEGLTYAEYAREGFAQLVWVAIINLSVFAVCLCLVKEDKTLRWMMIALIIASAVILASSFTRLGLYIDAYGLTFRRVQAFWMLCYLTVTFTLCGVRVYKKNLPLLFVCAIVLVVWYVALNIPDLSAWYAT